MTAANDPTPRESLQRRHLRFGWGSLFLFVLLGGVLEAMHGFKVDWYLAAGNETQRLMWRLAHAHGAFLSLVHLGFAVTLPHIVPQPDHAGAPPARLASACLVSASVALPGGFLLGAFGGSGGDPGVGIVLVPVALVLLLMAIGSVWSSLRV